MPRTNPGLDYFPVDVDMESDDKVELIEAKHGITGFAVILRLYMRIYRNSYFYEWGEKEQLLFSKRLNVDIKEVNAIINDALEWDIFSKNLFNKYGILTSKGIQARYLEAVRRRQSVELMREYLLLDKTTLNAHKNLLFVNIKTNNADITTQSKVKESKVERSSSETFPDDSLEMKMTNYMIEKILEGYPNARVPNTATKKQKWCLTFNRMMRIDGRTKDEIGTVMKWVYQDDFWDTQVRSPDKLREKWDTVYVQMNKGKSKKGKATPPEHRNYL